MDSKECPLRHQWSCGLCVQTVMILETLNSSYLVWKLTEYREEQKWGRVWEIMFAVKCSHGGCSWWPAGVDQVSTSPVARTGAQTCWIQCVGAPGLCNVNGRVLLGLMSPSSPTPMVDGRRLCDVWACERETKRQKERKAQWFKILFMSFTCSLSKLGCFVREIGFIVGKSRKLQMQRWTVENTATGLLVSAFWSSPESSLDTIRLIYEVFSLLINLFSCATRLPHTYPKKFFSVWCHTWQHLFLLARSPCHFHWAYMPLPQIHICIFIVYWRIVDL